MGRYISKAERQQMITLDALASNLIENVIPNADKFGKNISKRLKTAGTHIANGLREYMETLSPDDKERLQYENKTTQLVLTSRAYRPKEDTDEKLQIVWDLAMFAIGQNCSGCTQDGETCALKKVLCRADVPYTTTEPNNCPYELEATV